MTSKEKDKLAFLVGSIIDFTAILHPVSADVLLERIKQSEDKDILNILIEHMEEIRIFQIYRRFDHEASVRDIECLLNLIFSEGKGKNG